MISIITPTHNPKHLKEAYESLTKQTLSDWEWVVVANGEAKEETIRALTNSDGRVRVFTCYGLQGIGAIKKFSFAKGTREYLVELDHDDLLTSNALEEVLSTFQKNNADFVYSNFCEFFENGLFHVYPNWEKNGWRYRTSHVDAREVNECRSFPQSAAALSVIYYAPNHLRAWSRKFYNKIGGHDARYPICDDHDLLIRTYLQGKMTHIDKCLYLYRMGEQNSFSKNIDEIRRLTYGLYTSNLERLLLREGELRNLPCYNLGHAGTCPQGWNTYNQNSQDKVHFDLNERWPFKDNSVLAFRAYDIFAMVRDKHHAMKELHRCLVPGGWGLISVPSSGGQSVFQDSKNISSWNESTFWNYTRPEQARLIQNKEIHFMEKRLFTYFPSEWHKQNQISYAAAELVALKGDMEGIPGFRRF